jgi:hypothetical protein
LTSEGDTGFVGKCTVFVFIDGGLLPNLSLKKTNENISMWERKH